LIYDGCKKDFPRQNTIILDDLSGSGGGELGGSESMK
jgi:hypothetical protein